MTARQIFFGVAFLVWGGIVILLNRVLAEARQAWRAPWKRNEFDPLLGRILLVIGGVVSMLLGIFLLAGIFN